METKHFKILKYLNEQASPVSFKKFPNEITSDFDSYSLSEGSLFHELEIVLSNKEWIKESKTQSRCYEITEYGKKALNKETGNQSLDKARINPPIEMQSIPKPSKPTAKSILEIATWIIGIIAGLVAIYEFIKAVF